MNVSVLVGFCFLSSCFVVFGTTVTAAVSGLIIFDLTLNAPKLPVRVFVHVFCLQI